MIRFFISLTLITPMFLLGQSRIVLKENTTNKIVKLKKGKLVGLITNNNDTLMYADLDVYPSQSYWYLKSFSDTSLTIEFKRTEEIRTYNYDNIKLISFKRNESTGGSVAFTAAGLITIVVSPFIGITKEKYNFEEAGRLFFIGSGMLSLVYLNSRNRELLKCSIVGVK